VRYIQKAIFEDYKKFKFKHKPYFLPFTLFALFKVKTPIYPRKIELVLKTTNYFNFLAVQEYLKEFREKIKIIDVLKPIPGISHSISPAALLIIKDKGIEQAIFVERSKDKLLGTGKGLVGLPIDNTPIRKPTEEEEQRLKDLGIEVPDPDKEDDSLFFNRLIRGAFYECNININLEEIKILSFGLDTKRYLYNLIGIIKKNFTFEQLKNNIKNKQFKRLIPIPFFPKNIIRFIQDIPEDKCCPTTQAAAILALCQRFGRNEINKQIKRYRNKR
jgi:hypothetical protein